MGCETTDSYKGDFLSLGCGGGELLTGGVNISLGLTDAGGTKAFLNNYATANQDFAENIAREWGKLDDNKKLLFLGQIMTSQPPISYISSFIFSAIAAGLKPQDKTLQNIAQTARKVQNKEGFQKSINEIANNSSLSSKIALENIVRISRENGQGQLANLFKNFSGQLSGCDTIGVSGGVGLGYLPGSCSLTLSNSTEVAGELNISDLFTGPKGTNPVAQLKELSNAKNCTATAGKIAQDNLVGKIKELVKLLNWLKTIALKEPQACARSGRAIAETLQSFKN